MNAHFYYALKDKIIMKYYNLHKIQKRGYMYNNTY